MTGGDDPPTPVPNRLGLAGIPVAEPGGGNVGVTPGAMPGGAGLNPGVVGLI